MWSAAWHAAISHFDNKIEANQQKSQFERNARKFKMTADGKLSSGVCDNIKWLFWNAAWMVANEHKGIQTSQEIQKMK